jgi:RNA polymerase sigma-70 factor (ECF subfamily)
MPQAVHESPGIGEPTPHTTQLLLNRIRGGDDAAREELLRRVMPLFERWARGRVPLAARGAVETDDLVQVSLIRALGRVDAFESAHPGAFFAYLRQILLNAVRRTLGEEALPGRAVAVEDVEDELVEHGSALESLAGRENLIAYEQALAKLSPEHQGLVAMRFEFGMSFVEIAAELGETPDGVRVKLNRVLKKMIVTLDGKDEP